MLQLPLVSVIIPTYDRPIYLKQALESVEKQTYNNIEIIVVDDGSKVNYAETISKEIKNCKYFFKINGGLSSARNYGIYKSKGEFIAFVDDDDFWRKDKLEKQVKILLKHKEIDLVHSSAAVVNINSEPTDKIIGASDNKAQNRSGYVFWNALGSWVVKSPTPLIRKEVFQSDMCFDETIKVGEDIDFYQRLFYRHKIFYINEPLAFYRDFGNDNRLSTQRKKYIGIELKMIKNFKQMGIKNPWILHKISIKLLKQAIRNWNLAFPNNPKKINNFSRNLRPLNILRKSFKSSPCA